MQLMHKLSRKNLIKIGMDKRHNKLKQATGAICEISFGMYQFQPTSELSQASVNEYLQVG